MNQCKKITAQTANPITVGLSQLAGGEAVK